MTPDLTKSEILILQAVWELRALANHAVSTEEVVGRLPDVSKMETAQGLKRLEARGLVMITNRAGHDLFALSPLGAACVRQLLERQLGELTRTL